MSDTHGKVKPVKKLLDQYKGEVKTVLHLGDGARDLLQLKSEYPEMDFVAVAGNCDFAAIAQQERILTLGSKRILLTHGHNHSVGVNNQRLMYYALELKMDACLFGHTHFPEILEYESVFLMNPGSLGNPRGNAPSYGLLTINESITGELMYL